jgi:AhpD family alkylhydroperoxidase
MLGKAAPEVREALVAMSKLAEARVAAAGIPDAFSHLLRLRASQINGCAFCVRLHARDAATAGELADRIALVAAWRESGYFTTKERAQFALVEAITLISDDQVPDDLYREVVEVLSEGEIAAIEWLAVVINAWNRMSIASRPRVAP